MTNIHRVKMEISIKPTNGKEIKYGRLYDLIHDSLWKIEEFRNVDIDEYEDLTERNEI